jgi:hypothetical protein
MDFILGLSKNKFGRNSTFVVEKFSEIPYFIPCYKVDDACYIANLFFKKVVRLHGIPKFIVG